jgi:cytochrome b6-f complex iron-sulfur subunit
VTPATQPARISSLFMVTTVPAGRIDLMLPPAARRRVESTARTTPPDEEFVKSAAGSNDGSILRRVSGTNPHRRPVAVPVASPWRMTAMTPTPRVLPRRTVLAASGTAVLAAAAACSSSTTATTTTAATSAATGTTAAEASPTANSAATSAAASTEAAPTSAAEPTAAAPTGNPLASVADIEAAGAVIADGPDGPVVLAASGGSVVGHSAICTHQGCTIAASGMCPCHGSRFDVVTGAVQNPPANQPLAAFAVTVADGQVYAS